MSALAEALVAAQRRAVAVLEKAYVSGLVGPEELATTLSDIGAGDTVDVQRLLATLEVIREHGAQAPAEPRPNGDGEPAKATPAQVTYAQSLFQRGNIVPLAESDLRNMPRERISALIESLKADSYDPTEWGMGRSVLTRSLLLAIVALWFAVGLVVGYAIWGGG